MSRLFFIGLRWVGVVTTLMVVALVAVMSVGGTRRIPLITYGVHNIRDASLVMYDVALGQSATLLSGLWYTPVAWSWSPDGGTLAYVMFFSENNTYSVTLFSPFTRESHILASGLPFGSPPEWSPDGTHIALVSPTQDVCLYSVIAPYPAPNCLNIMPASQPVWSPDGLSIAYISRLPDGGLYRVDIASRTVYELLPSVPYLSGVRWSPTGEQLVFSRQESPGTPRHLMLIDRDGTNLTSLTAGFGSYNQALWSPDGQYIIFSYFPTSFRYPDVRILDVSTRRQQAIATHRLIDAEPQWSPDGELIAFVTDRYDGLPRLQIVPVPSPTDPEPQPSAGVPMQLYYYDWRP